MFAKTVARIGGASLSDLAECRDLGLHVMIPRRMTQVLVQEITSVLPKIRKPWKFQHSLEFPTRNSGRVKIHN